MMPRSFLILFFVAITSQAWAVTRYADDQLVADCTTGNYSIALRNCTGSDGNAYNDFASAISPMAAGDILYIRGGTWNQRIDLQLGNKTGTASAWLTIAGYPGESPVVQLTDTTSYGAVKARGNRGYIIFRDFIIDGTNYAVNDTNWSIRDGNHHFILQNMEIRNTKKSALYIDASDITVEDSYFHDGVSAGCSSGLRYYGIYYHNGSNVILRRNRIHDMPGGGIQAFPGPMSNSSITENEIYRNGSCFATSFGGIVLSTWPDGGNIDNVVIANNVIYGNGVAGAGGAGTTGNTGGPGHGIVLENTTAFTYTNIKVNNNTIYNNEAGAALLAYGIYLRSGANNVELKNNIVLDNETGQIQNTGTGNTITHNLCKAADSCGTTGKVSVTAATDVFVSTSDYRLKQGTNPARNAGTSVSTRSSPVGVTDIGAYEQGELAAAVVNDGIDLTMSVMTPGVIPTTGITAVTITCVGCTGTPVASSVSVQSGASNVVHIVVTGISASGTCRVSIGSTNMTDSLFIGGSRGTAQGINSATNVDVTGACANTGGVATPSGATAYYKLNEGAGTSANDETANNNDGTVSSGVTWTSVYSGSGLRFPTDATYRYLEFPLGASTNMATAAGGTCALIKADTTQSQKVVFSSGSNGTNQRLYVGWATIGGQLQWGIGIQSSGFASTGSEFPVTSTLTSVCLQWGSGTATLWVNGVKGTQSGKSVKTYTSYTTTATNFRYGNDGTFTTNNGGFDLDEPIVWTTSVSDATVLAYHTDRFPTVAPDACYSQANHKAQFVFVDGSPVDYGTTGATVEVIEGGSVVILIQINCTTAAGGAISVVPYYSTSVGGAFTLAVPGVLGADGVSMYGVSTDPSINAGSRSTNISGVLTNVAGTTVVTAGASPTITLAQDRSTVYGFIFTFGNIGGQYRCFQLKQDNGQALAGGTNPTNGACVKIVSKAAGGT